MASDDASEFEIGEEVLCHGKPATVRFIGEVANRQGIWIGVELRRAATGKWDGAIDGVQYFGPVEPGRASFVRASSGAVRKYSGAEEAATKLQAQARKKAASVQVQFDTSFRAFNAMESRGESDRLATHMNTKSAAAVLKEDLRTSAAGDGGAGGGDLGATLGARRSNAASVVNVGACGATIVPDDIDFVEPDSPPPPEEGDTTQKAPRLEFVAGHGGHMSMPRDCIERVLRHFKRPGCAPLAPGCMAKLLYFAMPMIRREVPYAVVDVVKPPPPGRVVVLGDTHGQLEDVLWLFFEHGEPSEDNVYIFNGDVADRGTGAAEIMTIILMFKLWDPKCIHMNRGNHEDPIMNESYGFLDECKNKWGRQKGRQIFDGFNNLFYLLPFATIVDDDIFIIHGGLCRRDFRLDQLRRLAFRRPLPERPGVGMDSLMFDVVWSDPKDGKGIGSNSRGDSIISFGGDVTKRFLKANGLRLLVRSHQVPHNGGGYEWNHDRRCLTIFSASNYCGDAGNLGGVLILSHGEPDQVYEHWAPPRDELGFLEAEADRAQARLQAQARQAARHKAGRRKAIERMDAEILRKVQELVVRRKSELFDYWAAADMSPRGVFCISPQLWREGCHAILDDGLPWVRLQEQMAVVEDSGQVHYVKFLARYRVAFDASYGLTAAGWENAVWSQLMEALVMADLPLREALAALDATSDGLVSGVEFMRLIESCSLRITPMQAKTLLRSLASRPVEEAEQHRSMLEATLSCTSQGGLQGGNAGRVSVWELLGRLSVSLPVSNNAALDPESTAELVPYLRPIASAILDDAWRRLVPKGASTAEWPLSKVLAAWFEDVDKSRNGYLEEDEFVCTLSKMSAALETGGCPSDADTLRRLARFCDISGDGRMNYYEFLNGLTWEDSLGDDFKEDFIESLHASIFFNQVPMRAAFENFDPARTGMIDAEDFIKAVRAVHTAIVASGSFDDVAVSRSDIEDLVRYLPQVDDKIDYSAFLKSFRIVDTVQMALQTPR